ncbi:HNH endonuclease [Aliihoeflea sp. 40Bstr573]|uniref:HNH endonuclease n=1 Tax=Aliihoeflea sp. 40Bstr573 TaxID=2696467 RepID=UPI00337317BD|nr:hypothetical protein [Aliihoeflea sp. 40Bstr573]
MIGPRRRAAPGEPQALLDRVALYGHEENRCTLWPFSKSADGYGTVRYGGRHTHAHVVICEKVHGPRPSPKHIVTHRCGNGQHGCITPSHVRWGTHHQNAADRKAHGRPRARLTEDEVRAIRGFAPKWHFAAIAAFFGVSGSTVSSIVRRVTWKWVV